MDTQQKNFPAIAAIIPAYNEGGRIQRVLDVVTTFPGFTDIIVIDDGSTDDTAAVVKEYPVQLVQHQKNYGKGQAMDTGVHATTAPIIFFCDADITGLTHNIIRTIITPVVLGHVDMSIGTRDRFMYFIRSLIRIIPLCEGQRAVRRDIWDLLPSYYKEKFRIEAGLNFFSTQYGKGFTWKVFSGLTQSIKEEKFGFWQGFLRRCSMYADIMTAQWMLFWFERPHKRIQKQKAIRHSPSSLFPL